MKMKKLISFLCAAALTVSSFTGLTITASAAAADTVAITPTVGSKTVTVKKEGTTVTQGVLLHAVYANGALTSVESKPIPATETGDAPVEYTKADYAAYASGTGSKILAWKSLPSMEPITVNIVEPPAAKTQVSTVADLTVAASNNNKAPATITATVAAKTGQTFTDTAAFTYAWTKDGVDINTIGATIENAAAGTYTVTATYNGTGDYEGSLGPATITITAADETRTNLSGATVALDKQTATVGDTVTATVTIGNENTNITDSADLTYQWYKAGETPTAVQGATAKTYTTTEAGTFYVTVSAAQASTTYVGTTNSGNVVVSEPVQAAPYVTSTDGKIKAISLYGGSYNETSQADKTYKQLKEDGIVTPIETRNNVETTGGETTYAEGVLLADNTTITDSKVASGEAITVVEVDIADVLDKIATHRISLKFDALTTFNTFNSEIYVSKLTAPTELATLTYTSLKELTTSGETNIGWGGRYTDATAMAKVITEDVAAAAEATETKLYYAIYTKTRENALSNFALTAEQLYTVAVDSNITGGTVTTDKATAVAGETVTVTVAATSGHTYTEDSLSVKDASNNAVATTPVEGQAGKYTFTMPASNATVTAGFTENTGTPSTLKYIFTTDGTANGKVAEETVFEDSSDYMVEDAKTIAVTSDYIKPYKTGAKKIYGSATNGTFRVYKYVSGLDNAITVDAADKEVLVTVADLGHDYYDYQDFDHNAWGKFTKDNSSGLKAGAEFQGNVLWCRGGGSAWSYTDGIDDSVVLTYEQAFTYGKDKTNPTIIKNAAGEEIVSYIYHIGSANNNGYMQSVKIAGVEKITGTATGTDLVGASWFNSNSEATIGHVELTIDKNAKTATIVFKKGTETKLTLSGSIESLKDMKLASWANQGGMNSDNNVPAINDFGVYKYTPSTPTKTEIGGIVAVKKGSDAVQAAYVNDTLTADVTDVTPSGATVSYQWQKQQGTGLGSNELQWVNQTDATAATFTPTAAGLYRVVVTGTGNYEGTVESASITVAARPTATVSAATLHDTRTTGAIADTDLATDYGVTENDGVITINATDLKQHQNGDTPETMGYWVGAKFKLTNVPATAKYYLSLTQPTGTIDYSERHAISEILDSGTEDEISIYQDAAGYVGTNKMVYFAVEGIDQVYTIDFTKVSLHKSIEVSPATLHDTRNESADAAVKAQAIADANLADSYSVTNTNGVIDINATNLKKHQNGDTSETMGYWVGAKFKLTNVPATARYYLSVTNPNGDIDYTSRDQLSKILDAGTTDEVSIYQDASDYVGTQKLVYFAVEGIDKLYTIDFRNVTRAFNITANSVTGSYTFADVTPTSAAEKSTVNIEVTPAENKALTGITVTKTGTDETVAVANGDKTGKYSFTMPSSDVTITANVSETSNLAPAKLEISPKTVTAKQGDTIRFTRTVKDSNGAVTSMNTVNWAVYTDAENTTLATNSTITDGELTIKNNEESEKLYVVATHNTNTALKDTAVVTVERNESNVTLQFYKGDGTTPVGAGLEVQPIARGYNLSSETEKAWTDSNGRASLNLNMNKTYDITVSNNGMQVATIDNFVPSTATDAQRTIHIPLVTSTADSAQGVYDLSNKIEGDKVVITPDKVVLTAKYTPVDGEAADMTYDAENNELYFLMPEKGVSNVTLSYVNVGESFANNGVTPTITIGNNVVKKIKAGDVVRVQLSNTDDNKKYAVNYAYSKGSDTEVSSVVNQRATQADNGANIFTFTVPDNIPVGNNLRLMLTVRQPLTSAVITGDVVVGGKLTAVPQYTDSNGNAAAVADTTGFTYQWYRYNDSEGELGGVKLDCTEKEYTVDAGTANEYIGKYIKVIAKAPDASDYYGEVTAVTQSPIVHNLFNIAKTENPNRYTVSYKAETNPAVNSKEYYGETVTFTVSPANDNYILSGGLPSVTKANNEAVKVTAGGDGTYTFTMPASDVTINPSNIVNPITKWTAMDGVEADTYTLTASTDDSSEETKDDVVTTFTIPAGTTPAFTFDLDHELGTNAPSNWNAGEITVSYDLKIDSNHIDNNGKWFMDLSTAHSQVAIDGNEGSDSARFGRMGGMGSTLYVAGGKSDTTAAAEYAYTNDKGLKTDDTWHRVTYKVDLKNKLIFAVDYDGQTHSVLMNEYEADAAAKFNASELYLNLGMTTDTESASTIKVKNVSVTYSDTPTSYDVSHRYDADKSTFDKAKANAGDTVTVTAPEGYKFTTVTVPGSPKVTIADDRETATFIMPIQNAVVEAYCTEIHTINNTTPQSDNETNNGYISIEPASAVVGETVTVTVHPKTGYEVDLFNVYRAGTNTLANLTGFTAPAEGSNVYTFTMPNENIDVNVTFKIKTFTVDAPVNGTGYTHTITIDGETITTNKNNVEYGKAYTYALTPAAGYMIKQFTFNGETYYASIPDDGESDEHRHNLPPQLGNGAYTIQGTVTSDIAAPKTDEVETVKIPYKITYSNPANGSSTIKVNGSVWNVDQTAEVGDVIQIKPNPAQGYEVNTVAVAYTSDAAETITLTEGTDEAAGTYTFTMPAAPVTIAVTFKAQEVAPSTYEVTFNLNGGSVALEADDGRTAATDPVKVTVNAGEHVATDAVPAPTRAGYILYGWKLADTDTELNAAGIHARSVTDDTFYTAQWTPVYEITLPSSLTGGTVTASATSDIEKDRSVTLTVDPEDGYQLKTISATYGDNQTVTLTGPTAVENSDNTTYTFQMPEGNVTVAAEFERTPHTVTLNAGDGAFAADAVTSLTVADGAKISTATELVSGSLPTPTKADYTFVGWKKGSTETVIADNTALADETVDADITYTAQFIQSYVKAQGETIKAVTLNKASETSTYAQLRAAGTYNEDQLKINTITNGVVTVVKVDVSSYVSNVNTNIIKLGFTIPPAANNDKVYHAKLNATTKNIDELTYSDFSSIGYTGQSPEAWSSKTENVSFSREIQSDIAALGESDEKVLYYVIFTGNGREQTVTNLNVTSHAIHTISIDDNVTGGTITPSKATAISGETITLTVNADDGKELEEDSLKVNNGAVEVTKSGLNYTFVMPDDDVVVTASFIEQTVAKYAVKLAGVPGYAQVYTSTDGETYTANPVAKTNHLGKIVYLGDGTAAPEAVTASDTLISSIEDNSTVYYKITKSGYTDFTGSITLNGEDATINALTMSPTDANVLFYDNGDWMSSYTTNTGGAFGGWNYRGDKNPKYISSQTKRQAAEFNPSHIADTEYEFSFNTTQVPSGGNAGNASIHQVIDSDGTVIACFVMKNSSSAADRADTYITLGNYDSATDEQKAVTGFSNTGTFKVRVNQTTGAVTVSYNGQTVSGTVSGADVITKVNYAPDGGDKIRLGIDAFVISKVS